MTISPPMLDLAVFSRSAPARLDVLGGLGAQAGGTVAQMALPRRITVTVQPSDRPVLQIESPQIVPPVGEPVAEIQLASLFRPDFSLIPAPAVAQLLSPAFSWAGPLLALYYTLEQAHPRRSTTAHTAFAGMRILIQSNIPMGAGQSSSTALLTAALAALCDFRQLKLEPLDLALLVNRAETLALHAGGHVIDALTCLLAEEPDPLAKNAAARTPPTPKLLRFTAQPHTLVGHVTLPNDVRIMALDTGVRYTAANKTLESLRLASAMGLRILETIYRDLGQRHTPLHGYLANTSPLLYRQYFRSLLPRRMRGRDFVRTYGELPQRAGLLEPEKLYRVRTAVDHLITEHQHAEQFLQAMEELAENRNRLRGPQREKLLYRAGRLALASHHSYRLRLELSCNEADWIVDRLTDPTTAGPEKGIYGARITGSGGGGTVMVLMNRSSVANDVLLDTYNAYNTFTGIPMVITEAGTPGSAGALRE